MVGKQKFSGTSTLFCLSTTNPLRALAIRIMDNPYFTNIILFLILANTVTLCLDHPLGNSQKMDDFLIVAEYIFLTVFSLELVIKIIAKGFFFNKNAFCKDNWNLVDLLVVVLGYLIFVPGMSANVTAARAVR
jgi:hypothetical protein